MLLTPSSINWTLKKFDALPTAVLINYNNSGAPAHHSVEAPDWLTVYDVGSTSLKVKLNANVNNLAAGDHVGVVNLFGIYYASTAGGIITGVYATLDVNLTLTDTVELSVTPSNAAFSFELGGTAPINQPFAITSENEWTVAKTAAWVVLPTTSGSNSAGFQIGVDVTGLSAGTYTDTVTIDDGTTPITVPVTLTVTDPNTGTDYLYVNPQILNFSMAEGAATPTLKNIEMNVSAPWAATADQALVNLTTASGSAGVQLIPIALQNVSGLAVGDHFANVVITSGDFVKTIVVKLTVFNSATELLTPGDLHFTDDLNYIKLSSGNSKTFMQLEFSVLYKSIPYVLMADIPFSEGTAIKRIGEIPAKIIGKQTFLQPADAALFEPYPTLNLGLSISELEWSTKSNLQTESLSDLKFIKGEKPIDNWISDQPKKVYLTKEATLYFSVLTNGITANKINVTGAQTHTFNFLNTSADFLTAVVPMADIPNLNVGDSIIVELLQNTIEVVIKKTEKQSSTIFWENKWGVWDTLELTGRIQINNSYKRKTAAYRKNELESENKIIDITKPIDYKIATGFVHTNEEVVTISKLLEATNMYLLTNNQINQVIPLSSKLQLINTDRELREFDLTFKNAIE